MEGAKRQGGMDNRGGGRMKMIKCVKKTCSTNFHNTIFSQYTPKGIWDAIVKKPKCSEMFYYQSNVSGPFAHAVRLLGPYKAFSLF